MFLTAYHISKSINGSPVNDFSDIIKDPDGVTTHDMTLGDLDFEAILYTTTTEPRKPAWLDFVKEGFSDADLPEVRLVGALLLVKVRYYVDHYFGFTFGQGRHLMKSKSYDKNFGLRVALNAIYDLEAGAGTDRIKSVESKTMSYNPMRVRKQADRRATFELFGTNTFSDQLKAITGAPMARSQWGTRISGADSVSANGEIAFDQLGKYCKALARTFNETTYQQNFSWIDSLRAVSNPETVDVLNEALIQMIMTRSDSINLTVPQLVDWDDIQYFTCSFDSSYRFTDPEDIVFIDLIADTGLSDELNLENLNHEWKFHAYDVDDHLIHSWTILQCLTGSLEHDDQSYVLSEGFFYEIDSNYEKHLNHFISKIPLSDIVLPSSAGDPPEGEYNEHAANSSDHYMLLDKKTVRISNRTSPIEICDVLTDSGHFVHVKRKLGSSSLSHLFGQGTVSADLYLMNPDYRQRCWEEILNTVNNDPTRLNGFSRYRPNGRVIPGEFEVVYAIVAKWKGRSVEEALPFFSKVNLRNHVDELRRMGYRVSMAPVEVI